MSNLNLEKCTKLRSQFKYTNERSYRNILLDSPAAGQNGKAKYPPQSATHVICWYCGKKGHTKNSCRHIGKTTYRNANDHQYPPTNQNEYYKNLAQSTRSHQKSETYVRCWRCGERGHTETSCRHKQSVYCNICGYPGHKSKHCGQ